MVRLGGWDRQETYEEDWQELEIVVWDAGDKDGEAD